MNSENTTPHKRRTPHIAKTAPVVRRREEEAVEAALDQEIADELLARIEDLETENRKLRKIASKGKGATDALRSALAEAERQQRVAARWMAAAAAGQAQLKEAAGRESEAARQIASEGERNERLLERTRALEALLARHTAHAAQLQSQAAYFATSALKLQRALEGSFPPSEEDFAALQASLDSSLAFVQ